MKRVALALLAFFAFALPATWAWLEWGQAAYASFFASAARPLYDLVGLGDVPIRAQRLRYINLVPFVGLMIVTPGLPLRRRLGGLAIGLLLLFASHLLLNALGASLEGSARKLPTAAAVLSDALPFVIWVVIARGPLARLVGPERNALTTRTTP